MSWQKCKQMADKCKQIADKCKQIADKCKQIADKIINWNVDNQLTKNIIK